VYLSDVAIFVAILCALAVPFGQLRTDKIVTTCCCPDPAKCHCPDHKPDHSGQSGMNACHKSSHEIVAPHAPAALHAPVSIDLAPPRMISRALFSLATPHAPPPPADPDGPS
jgi:hypothetical protein